MSTTTVAEHPPKATKEQSPSQDAIDYEWQAYARGLDFDRPPLTFDASQWEEQACSRLSSSSKGYVYGSAGVRETTDKNRAAFRKWSIVPRRLVKTEGFPNLKSKVLGESLRFPIAMAPIGVQKIFSMWFT
jgi:lactate 2-monooxygenase